MGLTGKRMGWDGRFLDIVGVFGKLTGFLKSLGQIMR
jgi:hypothetical protein